MGGAANIVSDESDPQVPAGKAGSPTVHVCPFCGTISDRVDEACRRCTMENTALTRQATRARIGPWYVMQNRNPGAPGMKCSTLLALVRKGQITPKTVIRGPTTHQFWRFAARVKGISREFGLCFSCGTRLDSKSVECPRCGKSQELPANPDTLLEGDSYVADAPYDEVKSLPVMADVSSVEERMPRETSTLELENLKPRRPRTPPEKLANSSDPEDYSVAPPKPAPAPAPISPPPPGPAPAKPNLAALKPLPVDDLDSRPEPQMRQENVLSAKDLATAFSLQYDPHSRSNRQHKSRVRRAIVMTVVLLLMGGGALVWFVPAFQQRAIAGWRQVVTQFHEIYPESTVAPTPIAVPPAHVGSAAPADAAPWSAKPPKVEVPITTPPSAQVTTPTEIKPSPAQANAPDATQTKAAPTPQPAPATAAPAASDTAAAPAPSAEDLDELAMKLHNEGLDAEARHDYASAVAYYQQIEKLPREHWPADTEQLLSAAQERAAATAGH
jgi:hypothetical protein